MSQLCVGTTRLLDTDSPLFDMSSLPAGAQASLLPAVAAVLAFYFCRESLRFHLGILHIVCWLLFLVVFFFFFLSFLLFVWCWADVYGGPLAGKLALQSGIECLESLPDFPCSSFVFYVLISCSLRLCSQFSCFVCLFFGAEDNGRTIYTSSLLVVVSSASAVFIDLVAGACVWCSSVRLCMCRE